jgi:hypothetical protein
MVLSFRLAGNATKVPSASEDIDSVNSLHFPIHVVKVPPLV